MATRIVLLAALLTASAARGTQFNWTPEVYPVPAIPYGLDWNIQLAPDPQPAYPKLSDDEVAQILPRVLVLEHQLSDFGPFSDEGPFAAIAAILIGSVFLLAAYEFIPRVHQQIVRYRSVDLRQNLLT